MEALREFLDHFLPSVGARVAIVVGIAALSSYVLWRRRRRHEAWAAASGEEAVSAGTLANREERFRRETRDRLARVRESLVQAASQAPAQAREGIAEFETRAVRGVDEAAAALQRLPSVGPARGATAGDERVHRIVRTTGAVDGAMRDVEASVTGLKQGIGGEVEAARRALQVVATQAEQLATRLGEHGSAWSA